MDRNGSCVVADFILGHLVTGPLLRAAKMAKTGGAKRGRSKDEAVALCPICGLEASTFSTHPFLRKTGDNGGFIAVMAFTFPSCGSDADSIVRELTEHMKRATAILAEVTGLLREQGASGRIYTCAVCRRMGPRDSLQRCGICKSADATYCSEKCQRKDWPAHKLTYKHREAERLALDR